MADHAAPISRQRDADADPIRSLQKAIASVNTMVLDKSHQVDLAFCALLAGGHLLIEDLPGVGKTTLAHSMAIILGGNWQRIQFTSDMLPADIVGVSLYRPGEDAFEFRPGPIFANVVLADEINRATPRTQSALLEAMAEGQVTVDGKTHPLPAPFFVIATQNPADLVGTYPLPDSQLDRFLLRTSIGYPSRDEERRLLRQVDRRIMMGELLPELDAGQLETLMGQVREVHLSDPVLDYIQTLVAATRDHPELRNGLSPRAALSLVAVARAHAFIRGRDHCLPEDVKAVFVALASHRLQPSTGSEVSPEAVIQALLNETRVP